MTGMCDSSVKQISIIYTVGFSTHINAYIFINFLIYIYIYQWNKMKVFCVIFLSLPLVFRIFDSSNNFVIAVIFSFYKHKQHDYFWKVTFGNSIHDFILKVLIQPAILNTPEIQPGNTPWFFLSSSLSYMTKRMYSGPILHIGGKGHSVCLHTLNIPFLVISNENLFKTQGNRLGAIVAPKKGLELVLVFYTCLSNTVSGKKRKQTIKTSCKKSNKT